MSAHIGFAMTPNGQPIVLSDWYEEGSGRSLVCHEWIAGGWRARLIDMTPFIEEFGLLGLTTGGTKQSVVDRYGNRHIAVYSDSGDRNTLYLALDCDLNLIERRVFPAEAFIGMGIDDRETVYLVTL